jgi:orotidine-5'-phosphate decarboxylase
MDRTDYAAMLMEGAAAGRSIVCMGLDPVPEYLPVKSGNLRSDIGTFFGRITAEMKRRGIAPGAFKPNIGYYQALDSPLEGDFSGSSALADLFGLLRSEFPDVPVILDAKRGDIARSSANYAEEAFTCWRADAVTVSAYMGSDSIEPFTAAGKGVYVLVRTSNPGASDLQDLLLEQQEEPLYLAVARWTAAWARRFPGTGAVAGATSLAELGRIAAIFAPEGIPLLIPGVGSQGGSGEQTVRVLREAGYNPLLARINSSSGITHPWKDKPAPRDWAAQAADNLAALTRETWTAVEQPL